MGSVVSQILCHLSDNSEPMIEERRMGNEPIERMLRRFNRKIQGSGILTNAKENVNFKKEPNRSARRASARRQAIIKKKREKIEFLK